MKLRIALAASLGAASLLAADRDAAAWTPLEPSTPRWATMPVGYYVNRSTIPPGIADIAVARIESGFASWANAGCTTWQANLLGDTTDRDNYNDGKSVFYWVSNSWPGALGDVNSVIGVTMPVWGRFDSIIVDADMVFNNVKFCWNDSGNNGCVDTQSIATHEQGHFLGLGHSNERGATMAAYYVSGSSTRTLEEDDIEGVCTLYPSGGTAAASTSSAATGGSGASCDSCTNGSLSNACRRQYDACGASFACRTFAGCIAECRDDACVDRCVRQHAEGASTYGRLVDCVCGACTSECSAECGGGEGGSGGAGGAGGSSGEGGAGATSTSTSSTGGASTTSATTSSSVASSSSAGGAGGAGTAPEDTPAGGDGESGSDAGCSCSTVGRSADLGGLALLGALGALASRRRRARGRCAAPAGRGAGAHRLS
ncbi:matrixin family metalloprotease [Sorangium sp. So ce1024]|uniref:matrixin family metalloprotease n=1 Tax=Sorangium sp. So ce1024 TaxID=3133327 RepID=UPI003F0A9B59